MIYTQEPYPDYVTLPTYDTDSASFADAYGDYCDQRNALHTLESQGRSVESEAQLPVVLASKAEVAYQALRQYDRSKLPAQAYMQDIREMLDDHPAAQEDALRIGADRAYLGAYLLPLSLEHEEIPSPAESIAATADNLAIVEEFVNAGKESGAGMLLSGSNTWGAFYAVRGGIPKELQECGVPQLGNDKFSDVDLMIVGDTVDHLEDILSRQIAAGLIPQAEHQRFNIFKDLYRQGKVDMFSLRSYYRGIEQSIHVIPGNTMEAITNIEPHRQLIHPSGAPINTVIDFRPNVSRHVRQFGAYPISDLRGLASYKVEGATEEVRDTEGVVSYISRSPVGGPAIIDGEPTFLLGMVTAFMSNYPVVVLDKASISGRVRTLQKNIVSSLEGNPPTNIPRQERMTGQALKYVTDSLS